jgi:HEAT repeat protein
LLKLLASNLKIFIFIFLSLEPSVRAGVLQASELDENTVVEILSLPLTERLSRLRAETGVRDILVSLSFNKQNSVDIRWRALTALGNLSPKSFRWEIEAALKSREWFMRSAGLLAVMHDERERAISWSEKALKDPSLVVRTQGVKNLIQLEAQQTRENIWQNIYAQDNLRPQSLWVRSYMAEALAKWARPGDQKRMLKLMMDRDPNVQRWAVLGLERATGIKLSGPSDSLAVQRRKWFARLGGQQI